MESDPIEVRLARNKILPASHCICKELGMDCSFEATGTTYPEVMREFINHAGTVHHMDVLTADILYRIKNAVTK